MKGPVQATCQIYPRTACFACTQPNPASQAERATTGFQCGVKNFWAIIC
jgi:hypothetical protein